MKFRVGLRKGDTLVEVMFAIGIFSLVAITITSVLMSGTSNMQTSLETTMARNEIDAQAEALRFIHQGYIAEKSDEVEGPYTALWARIKQLAMNNDTNARQNNITNQKHNLFDYSPSTCSSLYGDDVAYGLKTLNAFAIDTQNISSLNAIREAKDGGFVEASLYPRLFYSNTDTDGSLLARSNILRKVEGLYIVAVKDQDTTTLVQDDEQTNVANGFYDFYIRSCWYGYGKKTPTTISTLIRLYDPDVQIENHEVMDFVLSFDWNGHECGKVSGGTEECPTKKIRKSLNFGDTFPATTIDNVPAEGYYTVEEPMGWSTSSDAKCGTTTGLKTKGEVINDFKYTANASPFRTYYAVWECKYTITYNKNQQTATTGTVAFNPTGYVSSSGNSSYKFEYVRRPDSNGNVTINLLNTTPVASTNAPFQGWKCKSSCTGDDASAPVRGAGTSVTFHQGEFNRTYNAQWGSMYNYSLAFNLDGGSGSFTTQTSGATASTSYTFAIPSTKPTKASKRFKWWADGSNTYAAGDNITLYSTGVNKTLTAVWENDTPTPDFTSNTLASDCSYVNFILRWNSGDLDGIMVADKPGVARVVLDPRNGVTWYDYPGGTTSPHNLGGRSGCASTTMDNGITWRLVAADDGTCNNRTGQGSNWLNGNVHGERMTIPICKGWNYAYNVFSRGSTSFSYANSGLTIYGSDYLFTLTTPYANTSQWVPFVIQNGRLMTSNLQTAHPLYGARCLWDDATQSSFGCTNYRYDKWFKTDAYPPTN